MLRVPTKRKVLCLNVEVIHQGITVHDEVRIIRNPDTIKKTAVLAKMLDKLDWHDNKKWSVGSTILFVETEDTI